MKLGSPGFPPPATQSFKVIAAVTPFWTVQASSSYKASEADIHGNGAVGSGSGHHYPDRSHTYYLPIVKPRNVVIKGSQSICEIEKPMSI